MHGEWSTPWGLFLSVTGFTVGLKHVWQFPYHVGEHGGAAYLLVYCAVLGLLGVPLMMSQMFMGWLVRVSPITGMQMLVRRKRASHRWRWLGWTSVAVGFVTLASVTVVGAWLLAYVVRSLVGALHNLTPDGAAAVFSAFARDPEKLLFWHAVFVVATAAVVGRGLRHGLEAVARRVVPAMGLLLVLLLGYAASVGKFGKSLVYMFQFDLFAVTPTAVLMAVGDAFFSLSLGLGVFMMYGAYVRHAADITQASLSVAVANTVAGLLLGMVVWSIAFASGFPPEPGPHLVFATLPAAFDTLPLGGLMQVVFFVLLTLMAWMTAIGLGEPVVAWLVESRGLTRPRAALWCGLAVWVLGLVNALSFSYWAFPFRIFGVERTLGMADVLLILSSSVLMPLIGIGFALFAGWVLGSGVVRDELGLRAKGAFRAWRWLNRIVIPLLLLAVLLGIKVYL